MTQAKIEAMLMSMASIPNTGQDLAAALQEPRVEESRSRGVEGSVLFAVSSIVLFPETSRFPRVPGAFWGVLGVSLLSQGFPSQMGGLMLASGFGSRGEFFLGFLEVALQLAKGC